MIPALSRDKLARYLVCLVAGVVTILLVNWVLTDPVTNLQTDWTAFDNAGDRLISGEEIYRPWSPEAEPFPYLYPPVALWFALPLAALGFWGSFAFSALVPLAGYVSGLRMLFRAERANVKWSTAFTVALASGVAIGSTLVGQYSGIYVLAFGAGTLLFKRERYEWAGLVLALLWLKPNIAIVVPVALVWSRSWRTLSGFAVGTVGMLASSLPFGFHRWRGFVDNAQAMAELQEEGLVPLEKMVTVLAAIQRLLGLEQDVLPSIAIWLGLSVVLGVSVLSLWSSDALQKSPVRAFGALAVFAVAANPRLYFYDGAIAVFGMAGLWVHAVLDGGVLAKRCLPLLAAALWVGTWGNIWPPLNVIVGFVAAGALVVTAIDARRSTSISSVAPGRFPAVPGATPVQRSGRAA